MKIFCKKAYRFESDKGERFDVQPLAIMNAPDWVGETELFQLAKQNGNLEIISSKEQQRRAENGETDTELKELRTEGVELGIAGAETMAKKKLEQAIAKKKAELEQGASSEPGPAE